MTPRVHRCFGCGLTAVCWIVLIVREHGWKRWRWLCVGCREAREPAREKAA